MAASTETATNGNGNDYSYAAALKLYSIGEKLDNLQQMEDAIYLVNTYGRDFPSDVKAQLDIYTYRIVKSQQRQQHKQQPASNIHHYYHEQKEGQDLFSMVKYIYETLRSIESIDISKNNNKHNEQPAEGDSATKQTAA